MSAPKRRGPGIGVRLLFAQVTVLVAGAATTLVVALLVGPPLFREHLHRAGVSAMSDEQFHAEQAYRYATAISVGVAVAAAALTALVVTWFFSRRLQRSLAEVSRAATAVANGRYDSRVTPPRLGEDFDALAEAFNQMAARLESVESTRRRLFGDLAHEIRTPVSVLEAYLEALEDDVKRLTPETTQMLRDQTARLVRFSDDVAALAQAEEGPMALAPTSVDPGILIVGALTAVADRCQAAGIALTSHVPPDLPQLWADQQRLGQVLGNLLENAVLHTPREGTIDVSAATGDGELTITVTDTGDGVAAEHLPHLFERFYRVDAARDRARGGSGIGLAIAKAIVEAHGGRISAASHGRGSGAAFSITLPPSNPPG